MLATSEVIAGIRKMPPSTMPRPAAIETIQARTLIEVWKPGPSKASSQASPLVANQLSSRCRPTESTVISTNASPIERHRIERIGGDRICERALTAASNMAVQPLQQKNTRRQVDMAGPFGKGAVPHASVRAEYVFKACLRSLFWASMNLR